MAQPALVWTEVDSSNVNSVAYHEASRTLCVRFHSSGLYTYKGVDMEVYTDFIHAESVGQYLNRVVKPNYPFEMFSSEAELLDELSHTG